MSSLTRIEIRDGSIIKLAFVDKDTFTNGEVQKVYRGWNINGEDDFFTVGSDLAVIKFTKPLFESTVDPKYILDKNNYGSQSTRTFHNRVWGDKDNIIYGMGWGAEYSKTKNLRDSFKFLKRNPYNNQQSNFGQPSFSEATLEGLKSIPAHNKNESCNYFFLVNEVYGKLTYLKEDQLTTYKAYQLYISNVLYSTQQTVEEGDSGGPVYACNSQNFCSLIAINSGQLLGNYKGYKEYYTTLNNPFYDSILTAIGPQ